MSLGWDVVYLILLISVNFSNSFIKSDNLYTFDLPSNEYAFTFCPSKIISFAPLLTKSWASKIIFSKGLEYSGPRVYGTTQKLQNLSHPSWIVRNDETLLDVFFILSK